MTGPFRTGPPLALALLSTGCASLPPRPMAYAFAGNAWRAGRSETRPHILARGTASGLGSKEAPTGTEQDPTRRMALEARQAVFIAVVEVSGATRRIADQLSRLEASEAGIGERYAHLFGPFLEYGLQQLRWMDAELAAATRLAHAAAEVDDPEMQLALLHLAGPRIETALLGSLLLSVWADFLNLADVVLRKCPDYGVERLLRQMFRWRGLIEPALAVLAGGEAGQVGAAAADLPALVGHLTEEFASTQERIRRSGEHLEKMVMVKELIEAITLASAMKMALPRLLPSAAPVSWGLGLTVGAGGVMTGTQVVVSAEWVEMMRRLVRAGVLSIPAVSAAVRIQAGQVMMAQAHDDLPPGVREALGDGPEVRGMRVTDRAGAGMAEPPQHHVLPQEFREWFEQRGFTGEMSIDRFCVRMEQASHEAIHGGGNWRLGRQWPGEWNQMIMSELRDAETQVGRMLTRREVLDAVARRMRDYKIPMNFSPWRGL